MIIKIKDLRIKTIVGGYHKEREQEQEILVNLEIEFDGTKAAMTDSIRDTIDYEGLTDKIVQAVENSRFYLIEKMVRFIAEMILREDKVIRTTVEVAKPEAIHTAKWASIIHTAEKKSRCETQDKVS